MTTTPPPLASLPLLPQQLDNQDTVAYPAAAAHPAPLPAPITASLPPSAVLVRPVLTVQSILGAGLSVPAIGAAMEDNEARGYWCDLPADAQRICLRLFLEDNNVDAVLAAAQRLPKRKGKDSPTARRRRMAEAVMGAKKGEPYSMSQMAGVVLFWHRLTHIRPESAPHAAL